MGKIFRFYFYAMKKNIKLRIKSLQKWMKTKGLNAFIIPTTDPHNSEYVAEHWEVRKWLTGFTGSAGTAVVTPTKVALWTDSRYFLQAEKELKGSGILLQREKLPCTPSIGKWVKKTVDPPYHIGIDGWVDNGSYNEDIMRYLNTPITYHGDPFTTIWKERPKLPSDPIFIHELQYSGESCQEKLLRIRKYIRQEHPNCKGILLSALDEIAWTLNLRGNDVHCNPIFVSYFYITSKSCTLYIIKEKLTPEIVDYLKENKIKIKPYTEIERTLENTEGCIIISSTLNGQLKAKVKKPTILSPSPVALMKSIKNEIEQNGFRRAMERDGVAMVKFLKWLKSAVKLGNETELSIDKELFRLRSEQEHFKGISFDTIAGYGPHAAIVHYEATPETVSHLEPKGLLLLDSGAQYKDGTTDITRTIALGAVNDEEKRDYTLVLKGFLHLQNVHFPAGTCGTQIDIMARQFMWKEGINYLHGTGHGVGSYLCVHEGPHQIRMNHIPTPLQLGMIVTNEPGIYKANRHGIRTENTLLVVPAQETDFGVFYKFEALTLCPIDKEAICIEMMSQEEIDWLNQYHEMVYNRLHPLLDEEHRQWLKKATSPIH